MCRSFNAGLSLKNAKSTTTPSAQVVLKYANMHKLIIIMKALILIFFLLVQFAFTGMAQACINSYTFEFGRKLDNSELKANLHKSRSIKNKSLAQLNDYGVLLIYDRQYKKAIEIFKSLERQYPNLAKTAANLGTAYELNKQPELAKYWIEQGMKRDPNIHEGSEWIHVKILAAQLARQQEPKWIQKHDVLGLDFGLKAAPHAEVRTVIFNEQHYNLDTVLKHSKTQMMQRLQFVNHDPITAQILFNMANIEVVQYNVEDDAADSLYDMAARFGYHDPQLIEARQHYIQHSKWYQFKSMFAFIGLHLKQMFELLIAELKQNF